MDIITDTITYTPIRSKNIKQSSYKISNKVLSQAEKLIELAFNAKVSPLRVNQGAWYFASRVVGEERRMQELLSKKSITVLENEISLIEDMLPFK